LVGPQVGLVRVAVISHQSRILCCFRHTHTGIILEHPGTFCLPGAAAQQHGHNPIIATQVFNSMTGEIIETDL
jgi:hypothetical protein